MISNQTLFYGAVELTLIFIALFVIYLVAYNNAKKDQHCSLGAITVYNSAGSKTLTAANVVQSAIRAAATGAGFTYTLPSADSIIAYINSIPSSTCKPFTFTVINSSGYLLSFVAGTGVTTLASTVPSGFYSIFQIDKTSSTTVTFRLVMSDTSPTL
jgi:hypothetical protein